MTSGWSKVKDTLKERNLDDEFEKFLNESLSDESQASPKRLVTPRDTRTKLLLAQQQKAKDSFEKPWWATSEDDESTAALEATKEKWFKKTDQAEIESTDSTLSKTSADVSPLKPNNEAPSQSKFTAGISRDSLEVTTSRPGTALDTILSESERSDSRDNSKRDQDEQKYNGNQFDQSDSRPPSDIHVESENQANTNKHTISESSDESSDVNESEKEKNKEKTETASGQSDAITKDVGFETLDEINDKEAFFTKLETENGPSVDYADLNKRLNATTNSSPLHDGVEVEGLQPYIPPYYDDSDGESSNETGKNSDCLETIADNGPLEHTRGTNESDLHKPTTRNLLSKVALMESLDSTAGLNIADKMEKITQVQNTGLRHEAIEELSDGKLASIQTTVEFNEALQQVKNLPTQSSEENLNVNTLPVVTKRAPIPSGMLMVDQDMVSTLKVDQFTLQPVISSFTDEPKVIDASYEIQVNISKAEEDRGFSLQPITSMLHKTNESDSPPSESLKSIKSIAEERRKKVLTKTKFLKKDFEGNKTINQKNTNSAAKSKPVVPKTTSSTSKGRVRNADSSLLKISSRTKKTSPSKIVTKDAFPTDDVTKNLIASMESFTAYVKEQSHKKRTVPKDSTVVPTDVFKVDRETYLQSLGREKCLQNELHELRVMFETERRRSERLHLLLETKENEFEKEKQSLKLTYDRLLKDLQEKNLVLNKKLEIQDKENLTYDDIKKKAIEVVTEEEIRNVQRQLGEQETLLLGYQQENERLYSLVKKHEEDKKIFEGKLCAENSQLASEVANLKQQLDTKGVVNSLTESSSLQVGRLAQLNNQVKFYQKREAEHKEEVCALEGEVTALKVKLKAFNKQRHVTQTEQDVLGELKENHKSEIDKLQKRLTWYAENQQILDRDISDMNDKRNEIKELRHLVDSLEKENRKLKKDKHEKTGGKNSDAKKIQDLQRQIKEMEEIIRKRYPNSLPAMIYAASAVPGQDKLYERVEEEKSKPLHIFLEKQVKALESELEQKDEDNSKKIRALEQRYNAMELKYEDHIKQLELKAAEVSVLLKSKKTLNNVERELSRAKSDFDRITRVHEVEMKGKDEEIALLKAEISELRHTQKKLPSRNIPLLQRDVSKLREKLRIKEKEMSQLNSLIIQLKNEKTSEIATSKIGSSAYGHDWKPVLTDRTTSPIFLKDETSIQATLMEKENRKLKGKLQEILLALEERRLRYEALEAQKLHEVRTMQEEFEECTKRMEEEYGMNLKTLKMEFIVEHSNSKVAELNGKLKSESLLVEHLKATLEEYKRDRESLKSAKFLEETLRKEISDLQIELQEARKHFTPEMHHYKALGEKIRYLETRQRARDQEMKNIIDKNQQNYHIDIHHVEDKWRDILRNKDIQIQQFREELDSIIEVLEELQRQGVILPNYDVNSLTK